MKFATALIAAVCAAPAALAWEYKATWDSTYDDAANSVNIVACSGTLDADGYTDFGSLPGFPYIGGAFAVGGYDSPSCGTCWAITYNDTTINIFAIDTAANGFNIAKTALDALTDGQAEELGYVYVTATQVATSDCSKWN
ncbi:Cerato-platanin [Laetiporus sulphureus 93-53]|uniref:Cerato-platanin n=1 Tax=Laetiporus sulphureus 93-53 TaxID=1314785 RepID=A0A165CCT8_9APHY|nr:Cerato-platanin [Laetiporus sulphureus 93-53]KZT02578.1 Cerato-platanin [Laetiporus sulphureus 93-53]